MGYSKKVFRAAEAKLSERKQDAERAAEERRRKIYRLLHRTEELVKAIGSSGIRAARAVVRGGNASEERETLRAEDLRLQSELRTLLRENGYKEDVFEPDYSCKRCNDTGYYEQDNVTLMCPCLRKALSECACEELNRYAPLYQSTFENFSLDYYPTEPNEHRIVPREHMDKVYRYCRDYAANFSLHSQNLLFFGATGLGKTHLSLAIANEVIQKGFSVIYVSAPSLIQQYEQRMRSGSYDEDLLDMVIDCDLLIIDDLGSEFTNQFTVPHIYNLINSRLLLGRPIIISTNLSMRELERQYTYRLVSRLSGEAEKLNFFGRDIRIEKKKMKKVEKTS